MAQSEFIARQRTAIIKENLEKKGACCVGFADISRLDLPIAHKYPSGICFAFRHDDEVVNQLPIDELFIKISSSLTEKAGDAYRSVQKLLDAWGYHYSRIPSTTKIDELPDPGEGLPQKTLATLAGLGWIGKSTLLVTPRFGPRIRLGTLLTDMPLVMDNPIIQSRCGDCKACMDACPIVAIKGKLWSQLTPRIELLDVTRCYNHLWSEKSTLGRRRECGLCLKACPMGQERQR
jgi:epoxyqueuosine reductase